MDRLDVIDRLILAELQRDGRLTNQELADRVGLSPSPCLRRVRRLEDTGVISGYRAVVSPKAVDLEITAFVRLRLASHEGSTVDAVEERLRAIPWIVEAHLLAGDWDYLVRVVTPSFDEYERLLPGLDPHVLVRVNRALLTTYTDALCELIGATLCTRFLRSAFPGSTANKNT